MIEKEQVLKGKEKLCLEEKENNSRLFFFQKTLGKLRLKEESTKLKTDDLQQKKRETTFKNYKDSEETKEVIKKLEN